MITEITGDIFEELDAGRINVLLHQANCFHTMGGGIARVIAQRYPEAEARDAETIRGDKEKLGTYSFAKLAKDKFILNVYSQFDTSAMLNTQQDEKNAVEDAMAKAGRATRYDAIVAAFETVRDSLVNAKLNDYVVGIPYGYGSELAGGSWTIVRAIIESVFRDSPNNVVIVRLPGKKELK